MRRDYSAQAEIPSGHHQNWPLIEDIVREMERITDQWVEAETELTVQGIRNLFGTFSSVLDAEIRLGADARDVTEVAISRMEGQDADSQYYLSAHLGKAGSDDSYIYASGPVKKVCHGLVRSLQTFVLQSIRHPRAAGTAAGARDDGLEIRLRHLHPAMRADALTRLADGHGDHAVEEACKAVGERLRQLSGLDDDGVSLVGKTLSKTGSIAINDGVTHSDESEQEGYMHLARGLYLAARNPRAHRPSDPHYSLDEAIEWLSVASALLRALDGAKSAARP